MEAFAYETHEKLVGSAGKPIIIWVDTYTEQSSHHMH